MKKLSLLFSYENDEVDTGNNIHFLIFFSVKAYANKKCSSLSVFHLSLFCLIRQSTAMNISLSDF